MKFRLLLLIIAALAFTQIQAQTELYQVAFVTEDDVLNVRSSAGVSHRIIGTLAPDATDVVITGESTKVGASTWVPIEHDTLTGWVNRFYLTEQVAREDFCEDETVFTLIDDFKTAVESQDGEALQALIAPQRGLFVRMNWWNTEIRLSYTESENFFSETKQRHWGFADGSGYPIIGSTAEIVVPLLEQDLLPGEIAECNELVGGPTAGLVELPPEYQALNFYSVIRPAPDDGHEFDWGTWAVGVEFWDGTPYISYLVHYAWEI